MSTKIGTFIIELGEMDRVKLIPIDAELSMEDEIIDKNYVPFKEKNYKIPKKLPSKTPKKVHKKSVKKLKNIFNKKILNDDKICKS